jgi:hypothetical protein
MLTRQEWTHAAGWLVILTAIVLSWIAILAGLRWIFR